MKVTTVADEDVNNNGGDQSDTAVGYFLSQHRKTMISENNTIVQKFNCKFRKRAAMVGGTYDSVNDVFIAPKPYPSWTLNSDYIWQAPVAFPSVETKGGEILMEDQRC